MNHSPLTPHHPAAAFDRNLAGMIDHTLLKADASADQIQNLCQEALNYGFASVCINPFWVPLVRQLFPLSTPVKICTVIGFPLGATDPTVKAREATISIAAGANEVDMVLNLGALKSKAYQQVEIDIRQVVAAVNGRALVKVILETCYLSDFEKITACKIAQAAGANFVKTSTGFGPSGATVADITLMRRIVGSEMGVKASGGIRDYPTANALLKAGATRIGASAGIQIVTRVDAKPE
jgi:deoxyribose-phosphate aldolase